MPRFLGQQFGVVPWISIYRTAPATQGLLIILILITILLFTRWKYRKNNDYNPIKLEQERIKTFKNGEQNRENKGLQRALRYFWGSLAHKIKNSFILSERVASPAKNIAAPPFLENLQQGSIYSFSEHQSKTMYVYKYIYIFFKLWTSKTFISSDHLFIQPKLYLMFIWFSKHS